MAAAAEPFPGAPRRSSRAALGRTLRSDARFGAGRNGAGDAWSRQFSPGSSPWKSMVPAVWAGVPDLVRLGSTSTAAFARFAMAENRGALRVAV